MCVCVCVLVCVCVRVRVCLFVWLVGCLVVWLFVCVFQHVVKGSGFDGIRVLEWETRRDEGSEAEGFGLIDIGNSRVQTSA